MTAIVVVEFYHGDIDSVTTACLPFANSSQAKRFIDLESAFPKVDLIEQFGHLKSVWPIDVFTLYNSSYCYDDYEKAIANQRQAKIERIIGWWSDAGNWFPIQEDVGYGDLL